jgi:NADH-quinone oxidoreductase subunit M
MQALIIIIITIIAAVICFGSGKSARTLSSGISLLASIASLGLAISIVVNIGSGQVDQIDIPWLTDFGANLSFMATKVGALMVLLTSITFVLISLATWQKDIKNPGTFYGLMLLSMAGLVGVFMASNALLFYFFWELALIPVYFLANMYGGARRQAVSFKFFIYTFVGSLLMLVALIYLYSVNNEQSFAWSSLTKLSSTISPSAQSWLFWLMFVAFAIKMPIFPLHTWQPDAYEQTFTPVTIVLSALMVKMGLFAVLHWLQPILPVAFHQWQNAIIVFCIIGIIYSSILAMVQQDMKRVVAYSSIAHIGLMCAAVFSENNIATQGAVLQMFNHGINILGMWLLLYYVEDRMGTRQLNKLGGMAKGNASFAIFLVLITLANVALPLTNGFAGEFMMFNGIFSSATAHPITYTVLAGLGVILSAVYSLNLVQKIAFGVPVSAAQEVAHKFSAGEFIALTIVVGLILIFGFYPQALINFIS